MSYSLVRSIKAFSEGTFCESACFSNMGHRNEARHAGGIFSTDQRVKCCSIGRPPEGGAARGDGLGPRGERSV